MDETTSVLFGLDDHRVLEVVRVGDRVVRVVIDTIEREGACPACGVQTSNRAVAEVAAEHGVSWHTAHKALVAAAAFEERPLPAGRFGSQSGSRRRPGPPGSWWWPLGAGRPRQHRA
jgi:hypothetical protein